MTILDRQNQGNEQATTTAHWILRAERWLGKKKFLHSIYHPYSRRSDKIVNSRAIDGPEGSTKAHPTEPSTAPQDLIGLAAYMGLDLYVEEIIEALSKPLGVPYVNYLLSCALSSKFNPYGVVIKERLEKRLRLVCLLLHQGANPNEAVDRGTFWTSFLAHMYNERQMVLKSCPEDVLETAWVTAAKAFLDSGARPDEQISFIVHSMTFDSDHAPVPAAIFEKPPGGGREVYGHLQDANMKSGSRYYLACRISCPRRLGWPESIQNA